MKKIKSISNILGITSFNNNIVAFGTNSTSGTQLDIKFVAVESFYASICSDNFLLYQLKGFSSLFKLSNDFETSEICGDYNILGAFKIKNGIAVANKASRTYHFFDSSNGLGEDMDFYFNKTGYVEDQILYKRLGDDISFYSIKERRLFRKINLPTQFDINSKVKDDILQMQGLLFVPLSKGELLAYDVGSDLLKWRQEKIGKTYLYKKFIFCISSYSLSDNEIIVLDSKTGEVVKREMMPNLNEEFGYGPTGIHKVYDEYIFSIAAGKPGLIAVFHRESLVFKELIEVDEMIPIGFDQVHWHNGRLYVLDFGKTLHVFE